MYQAIEKAAPNDDLNVTLIQEQDLGDTDDPRILTLYSSSASTSSEVPMEKFEDDLDELAVKSVVSKPDERMLPPSRPYFYSLPATNGGGQCSSILSQC